VPEPDYIVCYGTGDRQVDGKWLDRSQIPEGTQRKTVKGSPVFEFSGEPVRFEATGEFEVRDDGAVAEIWREA